MASSGSVADAHRAAADDDGRGDQDSSRLRADQRMTRGDHLRLPSGSPSKAASAARRLLSASIRKLALT